MLSPPPKFARALMTKGVFACDCQIFETKIQVGILVIKEKISGKISLVDIDTKERVDVVLPLGFSSYKVELMRV